MPTGKVTKGYTRLAYSSLARPEEAEILTNARHLYCDQWDDPNLASFEAYDEGRLLAVLVFDSSMLSCVPSNLY